MVRARRRSRSACGLTFSVREGEHSRSATVKVTRLLLVG